MKTRPRLEGPVDLQRRNNGESNLVARPQYIEAPYPEVIEDQGPGLLLEYWDILRHHRGTLALAPFLDFLPRCCSRSRRRRFIGLEPRWRFRTSMRIFSTCAR